MENKKNLEELTALVTRLRGPEGCPWDREQTLESLRPFILEEAYELVDAIDQSRPAAICEELGDLLLEVLFVSQICAEQARFTIQEVMSTLEEKLVRRHPHVFRATKASNSEEALARWDQVKDSEKRPRASVLESVPRALPALVRAQKLSSRAAREGFDWSSADEVLAKLSEEVHELEGARRSDHPESLADELGDLLFVVVNLARHLNVDPEMALRSTNRKFVERFNFVQKRLEERNRTFAESSIEEMEELWEEAKKQLAAIRRQSNGDP